MAYYNQRPRMVIEESPWAVLFRELPDTLLNLYSLNQQLAFKSEEGEKSRKWEESMIYLQDQIQDKNLAVERFHKNKETAREIGVLPSSLTTEGGLDFTEMGAEEINKQNAAIDRNIDLYYQGMNAGNALDENASGFLEDEEVGAYLGELFPEGDAPEALQRGLQAWTLDPERRIALESQRLGQELTQQQIDEMKIKTKFLPEHEQNRIYREEQEYEIGEQQLEAGIVGIDISRQQLRKGEFEIDLLGTQLDEASLRQDQMRQGLELGIQQLSLGEVQLESATMQLDSYEFDEDVKVREYVTTTAEAALVGNIEAQTAIGASIMSNVSIRNTNGSYTPLFTLLTSENQEEVIDRINKSNYSKNIRQDLLSLVEAYHVGKGEDQLPDYSFVLDEVGKIEKLDTFFRGWREQNKAELEQFAIANGWKSADNFMNRIYDQNTRAVFDLRQFANAKETPYDVNKILKAIEWRGTGILGDSLAESREAAGAAKEQHKFLNSLLEQTQLKNLSAGTMYAEPSYTKQDTSAILAPFDIVPIRSGSDIDDIFKRNSDDEQADTAKY